MKISKSRSLLTKFFVHDNRLKSPSLKLPAQLQPEQPSQEVPLREQPEEGLPQNAISNDPPPQPMTVDDQPDQSNDLIYSVPLDQPTKEFFGQNCGKLICEV